MKSKLNFKNGKFKIMQIADIQENVPVNPDTIKLISMALDKEKPDLVVLTGDQIQGYSPCYAKDALNKVRECIYAFCAPLKERNIPFTMTFGNHDDDCKVDKKTQVEIYKEFDNFVMGESRCDEDLGSHILRLYGSENEKPVFNLYLIDSNKKDNLNSYAAVKPEQIEWFRNERDRLKEECGEYLPSFVFQHIPVPEYYDVLVKASKREKGSVEAYGSRKNTFWKLPETSLAKGDFMYESPASPERNTGEFEAIKEKGDILGIFVGHDHNNSFVIKKDGIDLGYTQGTGFNTYGPGEQRGVRIFVLDEKDLRNYETYTVMMKDFGKYKPTKPLMEFIYRMMPSSINDGISLAKRTIPKIIIPVLLIILIAKLI